MRSTGDAKASRLLWNWSDLPLVLEGKVQTFLSSVFTRSIDISWRALAADLRLETRSPGGWNQFFRPSWCILPTVRQFTKLVVDADVQTTGKTARPV